MPSSSLRRLLPGASKTDDLQRLDFSQPQLSQQLSHLAYQRYAHLVYAIAFRILKRKEDAEDITQDVFLKLYQQNRYDAQRGSLKAYLKISARSKA
ncbi:MAG: sigma factor, partial [Cyanobacteria bacterium P01_D01_bin.14]